MIVAFAVYMLTVNECDLTTRDGKKSFDAIDAAACLSDRLWMQRGRRLGHGSEPNGAPAAFGEANLVLSRSEAALSVSRDARSVWRRARS